MDVKELVESILASVQWDRWRFTLSARRLLKQDIAVVSHGHLDHWAANLPEKDVVLVPWEVHVPKQFADLKNLLKVDRTERVGKLRFTKVDKRALTRLLKQPVPAPHAFWWVAETFNIRVMFVGDVNATDMNMLRDFSSHMLKHGRPLHGVLLPSFGGVLNHGANSSMDLSTLVRGLACELHNEYGAVLGALPHPINAEWANFNAKRL